MTDDEASTHAAPAAPPPGFGELVDIVLSQIEAITDSTVDDILALVPEYGRGDLVGRADLTRLLHGNVERLLLAFAGRDPQSRALIRMAADTGSQRADQGIPLEALLQAYRLAAQSIWRRLLDLARSREPAVRDQLLDQAIRLWRVTDEASAAVASSYRRRDRELRRRAQLRREALLDALFAGRGGEQQIADDAEQVLGLPSAGRYVVVAVIRRDHETPPVSRRITQLLNAFRVTSVWRERVDRELGVILLGETRLSRVLTLLSDNLDHPVGVSAEVSGIEQLGVAAGLAELTAASHPLRVTGVAMLDDRLPEVLLVNAPHLAARLRRRYLARILELPAEEREVLVETLVTWLGSGRSAAVTASTLHCHRNTVFNRIRRIEELAGASLDDARAAVALQLALFALEILPPEPSAEPS